MTGPSCGGWRSDTDTRRLRGELRVVGRDADGFAEIDGAGMRTRGEGQDVFTGQGKTGTPRYRCLDWCVYE